MKLSESRTIYDQFLHPEQAKHKVVPSWNESILEPFLPPIFHPYEPTIWNVELGHHEIQLETLMTHHHMQVHLGCSRRNISDCCLVIWLNENLEKLTFQSDIWKGNTYSKYRHNYDQIAGDKPETGLNQSDNRFRCRIRHQGQQLHGWRWKRDDRQFHNDWCVDELHDDEVDD